MNASPLRTPEATQFAPLVEELSTQRDPWQVFRTLAGQPHAAILDSAMPHPQQGRYSYITADPFAWMTARSGHIKCAGFGGTQPASDPLEWLASQLANYQSPTLSGLPPFQGGALFMLGYDVCHYLERLPRHARDEFETPDVAVGLYDWVLAFDHVENRLWLISTGWPERKTRQRRKRAEDRARQVMNWLDGHDNPLLFDIGQSPDNLAPFFRLPLDAAVFSSFDRPAFLAAAARAIEYIHAGDCFQVNLAQRLLSEANVPPLELYEKLRQRNPAPFSAFFNLGDFIIASASPERFLRVDDREVETRPIKGTRPRGKTPTEDKSRQRELLASAKDRAENVMIVDLLRNDLGRVCEYGSIHVPALCELESYEFVHHLVSEVRGRLRRDKTPVDLLRAAFPGGSVTGAPKIRAMEIIAELEPTARGPYCGSLGYISFNGNMDSSILIRTFTIGRGWMQFPVGGGIVADSDPQREYEETLHKAEGLLRALI